MKEETELEIYKGPVFGIIASIGIILLCNGNIKQAIGATMIGGVTGACIEKLFIYAGNGK